MNSNSPLSGIHSHLNFAEVLRMAIRIEQNGRAFYLRMADMYPDHREFLMTVADEEIVHEEIFTSFLNEMGNAADSSDDLDGTVGLYLSSIADSVIFKPMEEIEDLYTGRETIEQILGIAVSREQDSVTFFTGIKDLLSGEKKLEQIDRIIHEEMKHIGWLMKKKREIESGHIQESESQVLDLVVIGAGPGGVSLAAESVEAGIDREKLVVLEKAARNSWIIRKLYPDQKLVTANYKGNDPVCHGVMKMRNMSKADALSMLNSTISDYQIPVIYEVNVTKVEKKDGIFHIQTNKGEFQSKLCAVGIGVFGKPNKPAYKIPPALKKMTHFDLTSTRIADCDVMVVGGGDSSAEYVKILLDEGNKVTLVSRDPDLSFMNDDNQALTKQLAESGKISFHIQTDISGIEEDGEKIQVNFEGDLAPIIVDRIVYALGGTTPMNFLQLAGVDVADGWPVTSEKSETNVPGLYLVGDLAAKKNAGAIVAAFNNSYKVSEVLQKDHAAVFGG